MQKKQIPYYPLKSSNLLGVPLRSLLDNFLAVFYILLWKINVLDISNMDDFLKDFGYTAKF